MELTDTHCHPFFPKLAARAEQVIADARAAGVTKIIAVGTSLADSGKALDFAGRFGNVWASIGVHPHEAENFLADKTADKQLRELLNKSSNMVAIGEIGLDYYKNPSSKEAQLELLRRQIEMTKDMGLPYVFHVRDAWEDFWKTVDAYPGLTGVVHSFSSGTKQLKKALDRGFYIGLNGIMTFTKDESQLLAARNVPAERLLLETDAPFLAPEPYRGQVCEPKHVRAVAEFLARLRAQPLEELAAQTTANADKLFKLENHEAA